MSEQMNNVSKDNIRAGLNLVYSMMRFLAMIIDMAATSKIARDTIVTTAEAILNQAAELYSDVGNYATAIANDAGRVSTLQCRNDKTGDDNETNNTY